MNEPELTAEQIDNIQFFHRYLVSDLETNITYLGGEISEARNNIEAAIEKGDPEALCRERLVYAAQVQAWISVAGLMLTTTRPNGTMVNEVTNTNGGTIMSKIFE